MGDVQITAHGPLFDGRAEAEVARFLDEAKEMVAEAAKKAVDRNLEKSIRHPGSPPYYQSQINVATKDRNPVVNDAGVIYGWWLEGTGSRNAPVTKFAGYHSFSRAEHEVDAAQDAIVGPALVRLVARLQ
jgi:hypothetical protein